MFAYFFKAIGAAIEFNGNVSFTNNDAESSDGGALYLLTSSQILVNIGTNLEFVNNTGGYVATMLLCYHGDHHRLGASIVVAAGTVLPVFARNYYNPLCFIQYPDPEMPPIQWDKVKQHTQLCLTVAT